MVTASLRREKIPFAFHTTPCVEVLQATLPLDVNLENQQVTKRSIWFSQALRFVVLIDKASMSMLPDAATVAANDVKARPLAPAPASPLCAAP